MNVVVRQFGSGRCHVADTSPDDLTGTTLLDMPATVVARDPVVTVCGVRLAAAQENQDGP